MSKGERDLRTKLRRLLARHERRPTAESWFALGALLADASARSPELGRALGQELEGELGVGEAVACWRRCTRLAPTHAKAWHRIAQASFDRGERAAAVRAYTRALELDPHVPAAWNNLAVLTMPEAGEDAPRRVRRAEEYFHRAIEEDRRGKQLGWEPYAWLAEIAERRRDDPGAVAWYREATRRGDRYAAARKQVIEDHGARRRSTTKPFRPPPPGTPSRPKRRSRAR